MSEIEPDNTKETPTCRRTTAVILSALAISSPAFYFAFANTCSIRPGDGVVWVAIGAIMTLCLATGIAYVGLTERRTTAEPGESIAFHFQLTDDPKITWLDLARLVTARSRQLCNWIVPCLWLTLASYYLSYVIGAVWPSIPVGGLWIFVMSTAALALCLSYLPSRAAELVIPGVAAIQVVIVIVFSVMLFANRKNTPARSPIYVLDADGNPREATPDEKLAMLQAEDAKPGPQRCV